MNYQYEMIHSNDSSQMEDYWYANASCTTSTGETFPCEEIYFEKSTNIPSRSVEVRREEAKIARVIFQLTSQKLVIHLSR